MLKDEYPAMWHFLGAYLYQDWREDYADTDAAVRDFRSGEPHLVPLLPPEIDKLLESTADDAGLHELLVALGSFYLPRGDSLTAREWLRHLRAQLTG